MTEIVELFEFRTGDEVYRFTSRAEDGLYDGHAWQAVPIRRSAVSNSQEAGRNDIRIYFPLENEFARKFMGYGPDQATTLTIRRNRYSDPDHFNLFCVYRVVDCELNEAEITLSCQTLLNALSKSVRVMVNQRFCIHTVYHRGCNLDKDDFAEQMDVVQIGPTARTLTVPAAAAFPAGYFTGGMVALPDGVLRYISQHDGEQLSLWRPSPEIMALIDSEAVPPQVAALTFYPGCDQSLETCDTRFNNLDNNLGCYWIPDKNPIGSNAY